MTPPTKEWTMPVWHLGKKVLVYDSLPSTNDFAAALAAEQEADGLVVLAHEQTAGKGQYGKSWHSPAGAGVYLSAILNPPEHFRRPVILTAFAAIAMADVVQALTGKPATIKWPNDVLVDGKKICGLLIEQGKRAIIGVGLNVNQSAADFAAAELPDATSLAEVAGQPFEIEHVARNVLLSLDRDYSLLASDQVANVETRWKQRLGLLGLPVVVELNDGRSIRGQLRQLSLIGVALALADGSNPTFFPEQVRRIERASD
jgi:BirA family biotin operon repressor/biotin-[acetyl-CoA-carboxylase] ligase